MNELIWQDSYSVGVKILDEQHMKLFCLINQLRKTIVSQDKSAEIPNLLVELEEYVQRHFKTEESLLKKYDYYGLEQQKKEHQLYEQRVLLFHQRINNSENNVLIEMVGFLVDWWSGHIQGTDLEYRFFLNNRGVF